MTQSSIYHFLITGILLFGFMGCTSESSQNSAKSDCKYGKPVAIFSQDDPSIKSHSFEVNGNNGVEKVKFAAGIDLELEQSGCNNILQIFKFRIPGKHHEKSGEKWVEAAISQLRFLGSLNEKYAALSFWANEIETIKSNIKLGATTDIKEGFKVKIDKVLSINHSILEIELSQ